VAKTAVYVGRDIRSYVGLVATTCALHHTALPGPKVKVLTMDHSSSGAGCRDHRCSLQGSGWAFGPSDQSRWRSTLLVPARWVVPIVSHRLYY
jgi:hypothetical protein